MGRHLELQGQEFGRWTVIRKSTFKSKDGAVYWDCLCECGTERPVAGVRLNRGHSLSCGCSRYEIRFSTQVANGSVHGEAARRTPEYMLWDHIKGRCYNKKAECYPDYGGRGITVCDRWLASYQDFLADVGRRPAPNLSLDRIDNDGNYEPGNIQWANDSQQNSNQRRNKRK